MDPTKRPFILTDANGVDDGFLWSTSLGEAQRRFAQPRRWASLAREGWTVTEVERAEFIERIHASIVIHGAGA